MDLEYRAIPLFLSSTFHDMQAERDRFLRDVVGQLDEWLKPRRCRIEPIDMRWGIDDSARSSIDKRQTREAMVLRVRLEELERAQPLLVVLLGSRYGTVFDTERIRSIAEEKGIQVSELCSITELEVRFGVFALPRSRAHVYFRELTVEDGLPVETLCEYDDAVRATAKPTAAERREAQRDVARLRRLRREVNRLYWLPCSSALEPLLNFEFSGDVTGIHASGICGPEARDKVF